MSERMVRVAFIDSEGDEECGWGVDLGPCEGGRKIEVRTTLVFVRENTYGAIVVARELAGRLVFRIGVDKIVARAKQQAAE